MELLYLYIKRYDDVFENQQINFSSNYNIEYKDGCLNIEYKNNNMKGYYGDNIKISLYFMEKMVLENLHY